MTVIETTAYVSLAAQLIVGLASVYATSKFHVKDEHLVLKDLLQVETIVTFIEFTFYVWLVNSLVNDSLPQNVTSVRYLDWFLTTPMMLVTTFVYLHWLKNQEIHGKRLLQIVKENLGDITTMVGCNALMLILGFLAETGAMQRETAVVLGFLPFVYVFYILHKAAGENSTGRNLLAIMTPLWTFYGLAAFFDYEHRNATYNLLDIFSKNFYSVFLVYQVYTLT